jgi:hypothetical protein
MLEPTPLQDIRIEFSPLTRALTPEAHDKISADKCLFSGIGLKFEQEIQEASLTEKELGNARFLDIRLRIDFMTLMRLRKT